MLSSGGGCWKLSVMGACSCVVADAVATFDGALALMKRYGAFPSMPVPPVTTCISPGKAFNPHSTSLHTMCVPCPFEQAAKIGYAFMGVCGCVYHKCVGASDCGRLYTCYLPGGKNIRRHRQVEGTVPRSTRLADGMCMR